jgi:hypothetical protein
MINHQIAPYNQYHNITNHTPNRNLSIAVMMLFIARNLNLPNHCIVAKGNVLANIKMIVNPTSANGSIWLICKNVAKNGDNNKKRR